MLETKINIDTSMLEELIAIAEKAKELTELIENLTFNVKIEKLNSEKE